MTKKKPAKRNPQDLTLRNIRALKKSLAKMEGRIVKHMTSIERRIDYYARGKKRKGLLFMPAR